MGREIKFRGLSNRANEFVFGSFFNASTGMTIVENGGSDGGDFHFIKEETLGQFTGLKDKNGVDIYDGDILKINLYDDEWTTKVRDYFGTLIIDVEGCDWNTTTLSFLDDEAETEVIGNIHETPNP